MEPLKVLVSELTDSMLEIDPELDVRPAVGKTIARIYGLTAEYRRALRELLKKQAKDFSEALDTALREPSPFTLYGEDYKRTQDPDVPENLQVLSQKKEFSCLAPLYRLLLQARRSI